MADDTVDSSTGGSIHITPQRLATHRASDPASGANSKEFDMRHSETDPDANQGALVATAEQLEAVTYNADGLVPAIIQDDRTGDVLMMAWMSPESLALTLAEGRTVFWSRSRQELWRKGETSGEVQKVRAAHYDCDGDTLLFRVEQAGGSACHTGAYSCFYQRFGDDSPRAGTRRLAALEAWADSIDPGDLREVDADSLRDKFAGLQHEKLTLAEQLAGVADELDVKLRDLVEAAPFVISGVVDGFGFYLRERHGTWKLVVAAGDDLSADVWDFPRTQPVTCIASGRDSDFWVDGKFSPDRALRIAVDGVRRHRQRVSCKHPDARVFCPDCGCYMVEQADES